MLKKCFICGSSGPCEHRETGLLSGRDRQGRMFGLAWESRTSPQQIGRPRVAESDKARKRAARQAVKLAINSGILIPSLKCEACDSYQFIQAHHRDYAKPLEVIWLCKRCHVKADALRKIADVLPVETVEKLIRDGSVEIPAQLYQQLFRQRTRVKPIDSGDIHGFHRAG